MRIPRLPLLTFLLGVGLLAATTHPAFALEIKCGAHLGPGGVFVLTQDLTCLANPSDDDYEPALTVFGGATLNLNGHTVSCGGEDGSRGRQFGIELFNSTLRNGTVTGCGEAVRASASVVKRVTVSKSGFGIYMQLAHDSLIKGNTAIQNSVGFGLEDGAQRNTLINNTATQNWVGFDADSGADNVFIGNTATGNRRAGFALSGTRLRVTGNHSHRNGLGFSFLALSTGAVEIVGNVAKSNLTHGFAFDHLGDYHGDMRLVLRDNAAKRNGGDGFVIRPAYEAPGDASANLLQDNYAVHNNGHGIHILVGRAYPPPLVSFSHATIASNTSLGHTAPHFDLADDNANCQEGTVWQDNRFLTASQSCIQ
jgi:parallel beta-helix repeat protein